MEILTKKFIIVRKWNTKKVFILTVFLFFFVILGKWGLTKMNNYKLSIKSNLNFAINTNMIDALQVKDAIKILISNSKNVKS